MLMTFKYLLQIFVSYPNIFVWIGYRSIPQIDLLLRYYILFCCYLFGLQTIFLYFPYKNYSSAEYHLSGQVIEASLRQSDSLIAAYIILVLFSVCQTSLPSGQVKKSLGIGKQLILFTRYIFSEVYSLTDFKTGFVVFLYG